MPEANDTPTADPFAKNLKQKEQTTEEELAAAKELELKEGQARKKAQEQEIKDNRIDGMDSYQRQQEEATNARLEELREEFPDSRAVAMSPEYSPPGTIRGTDGSNANFNPDRVSDPNGEWVKDAGEDEEQGENYEPKKIPE